VSRPNRTVRLFVPGDLSSGARIEVDTRQAHYLDHVLRMGAGEDVFLFNGRDGEWRGAIAQIGRGGCLVEVMAETRGQESDADLWLVFSPIKRAGVDFIAAKATELGVAAIWPVMTEYTAARRINTERLHANAVEAAEQSGRVTVPEIKTPVTLDRALAAWPLGRRLLLCDESGESPNIADVLMSERGNRTSAPGPWAVMTGPEGGFARSELDALRKLPFVTAADLGPRIMRADTAALAALSCWQAVLGDWRSNRA
jgi:16S rRNA (uracil1498-N3)-methyltransferase